MTFIGLNTATACTAGKNGTKEPDEGKLAVPVWQFNSARNAVEENKTTEEFRLIVIGHHPVGYFAEWVRFQELAHK